MNDEIEEILFYARLRYLINKLDRIDVERKKIGDILSNMKNQADDMRYPLREDERMRM